MKKITLISVLCFVIAVCSLHAQTNAIKVSSTGKVGINLASPTYQLDVAGDFRITNTSKSICYNGPSLYPISSNVDCGTPTNRWGRLCAVNEWFTNDPIYGSDERIKRNIADLTGLKDKFLTLRPVSYQFIPGSLGISEKDKDLIKFGFIAQEVKKVFPDMVSEDENGLLGIQYGQLIPVLVQIVKDQQKQIDLLNERIMVLENLQK